MFGSKGVKTMTAVEQFGEARITTAAVPTRLVTSIPELLRFRAAYLEQKLLRLGIAANSDEAMQMLHEVTKYLVLGELHWEQSVPMFSTRLDEVWHQFVLFTAQYQAFCARFAGAFLHHAPDETPRAQRRPVMSFAEFRASYEAIFGELSPLWFDELWLLPTTRLVWSPSVAKQREVYVADDRAVLAQTGETPRLLCRVSRRAEQALRFMLNERCFLVRELPGLADNEERIALCKPLVQFHVLRVAP
jgi:hypothetical protein